MLTILDTLHNHKEETLQMNSHQKMNHFSEKCEVPKYDVKIQTWGPKALGLYPDIKPNQIKDEQWPYIFYDSTNVTYYQQIPILSFWGFLSSAGGSLGLFLGFSCYSFLSTFVEYLKAKFSIPYGTNCEISIILPWNLF